MTISAVTIFILFQNIPTLSVVGVLERYSFGVYLVHPFWPASLAKIGLSGLTATPLLGIPLTVAATTLLSAVSAHMMLRIKWLRPFV